MMLECSTSELLARTAFMHHDDKGYAALKHSVCGLSVHIYIVVPGIFFKSPFLLFLHYKQMKTDVGRHIWLFTRDNR